MKKTIILLMIITFVLTSGCNKKVSMVLKYSDGSGNSWVVSPDVAEYIPVTKEMSSSGTYSGGEPAKKSIEESEFNKVNSIFDIIFAKKEIQIKDRIMTSGLLQRLKGETTEQVIIMHCEEQMQLEEILRSIMKN